MPAQLSRQFNLLFLFIALFLLVMVANGLYNMYDGVPNRDCRQAASINLTIESQGLQMFFDGCKVEGCHVGCYRFDEKVKQFMED
jgi:hypothetical protein